MALDRNLIITVEDYDNIKTNRQLSFFKDTVITLDITILDIHKYFDINHKTEFVVNVVFVNGDLERYYEKSEKIPVYIAEDNSLNFTVDIMEGYTKAVGNLKMQINITDYDLCNVFLPVITIPIKPNLLEDEDSDFIEIEATDVLNNITADGVYDDNDALGAIQAAELIGTVEGIKQTCIKTDTSLKENLEDISMVINEYKKELDELKITLKDNITLMRLKELKELLGNVEGLKEAADVGTDIKDIRIQLETMNAHINNRVTSKELSIYKDAMDVDYMALQQSIGNINNKLDNYISDSAKTRESDLKKISDNFLSVETDLETLKVYEKETKHLAERVDTITEGMKEIIGDPSDEDVPVLKTYRIMKLKMYKNNHLAILSDTSYGNTIRVADGHDVIINFEKEVDSVFIETVSPYSRLKFLLKSLEPKKAVIKCFNMEEIIEEKLNEVTQQMESVTTWDIGDVNIHELPEGLEVHILYLA